MNVLAAPPALSADPPALSVTETDGAGAHHLRLQTNGTAIPFTVVASPSWLSVQPASGTAPTLVQVLVDFAHVDRSSFLGTITVTPTVPGVRALTIPVTVSLSAVRRYSIPQIADGGPFQTTIILVNNGPLAVIAGVRFFRSDPATRTTQPWNPAMVGNVGTENLGIQPGSSYTLQTAGQATNISAGWAEVTSTGPLSGLAVFRARVGGRPDQEAAVPINLGGSQRFFLPYDNQQEFRTTLAVANLTAADAANLTITFRSTSGQTRSEGLGRLPPQGHMAFSLVERYAYLNGDRGVAEFSTSTGQLSVLGLRFNPDGAFTSFGAQYPQTVRANRYTIPHVADGGAYRTTIILVNNSPVPAKVGLRFRRSDPATHVTEPWTVAMTGNAPTEDVAINPGQSVTRRLAALRFSSSGRRGGQSRKRQFRSTRMGGSGCMCHTITRRLSARQSRW
jgi:hypothetical protein